MELTVIVRHGLRGPAAIAPFPALTKRCCNYAARALPSTPIRFHCDGWLGRVQLNGFFQNRARGGGIHVAAQCGHENNDGFS